MFLYRIYGLIFETDIEFDECEAVDDSCEADVYVRYNDLQEIVNDISAYKAAREESIAPEDDRPDIYSRKEMDSYVSYVVDVMYVRITGDNIIEYRNVLDTTDIVFHQWVLCYAMTLALIRMHKIVLHCAGVLVPGTDNAVLVCGDSGAGKSTISDALLNKGMLFISDDSVRVASVNGEALVYGSYRQRRLCEDVINREGYDRSQLLHYREGSKEKWAFNMGSDYKGGTPHKFRYLFFLTLKESGEVCFKEVTGPAKITQIMCALYKTKAYKSEGATPALLTEFAAIAKDVKIFVIERPAGKNTIDDITKRIMEISDNK